MLIPKLITFLNILFGKNTSWYLVFETFPISGLDFMMIEQFLTTYFNPHLPMI